MINNFLYTILSILILILLKILLKYSFSKILKNGKIFLARNKTHINIYFNIKHKIDIDRIRVGYGYLNYPISIIFEKQGKNQIIYINFNDLIDIRFVKILFLIFKDFISFRLSSNENKVDEVILNDNGFFEEIININGY